MATDTSAAFKTAAIPALPGSGDVPPVTPSQQVADQQLGLSKGPPPPSLELGGQAVINQTHRDAMVNDGRQSDQANHYTRTQSPASAAQIKAITALFAKQAEQNKQKQQTKTIGLEKDKGHER